MSPEQLLPFPIKILSCKVYDKICHNGIKTGSVYTVSSYKDIFTLVALRTNEGGCDQGLLLERGREEGMSFL